MEEHLKIFHRDKLTLQSHHWKYYLEYYTGCTLGCVYCLNAYSKEFFEKVNYYTEIIDELKAKLPTIDKRIIFLGSTSDPYNKKEEKLQLTRKILELCLENNQPVTVLTKSLLIERDLDIIKKMNEKGLILVQFTITTNDEKCKYIEKGVTPTSERLDLIKKFTRSGIQVHVHFSPIIPFLNTDEEMSVLIEKIAEAGVKCIYTNILGIHFHKNKLLYDALEKIDTKIVKQLKEIYPMTNEKKDYIYSPNYREILEHMNTIRKECIKNNIGFVNEAFPYYTDIDKADMNEGVFRYALPTIYDMIKYFKFKRDKVNFDTFFNEFLKEKVNEEKDKEYINLLRKEWEKGDMFENSDIRSELVKGDMYYYKEKEVEIKEDNLVWNT